MKKNKCKNCTHYSAYYKLLAVSFTKLNHGFCAKHKRPQAQKEICDDFNCNQQKEQLRERILFDALENALKSIDHITQILKLK